jgi:hypothetical protein
MRQKKENMYTKISLVGLAMIQAQSKQTSALYRDKKTKSLFGSNLQPQCDSELKKCSVGPSAFEKPRASCPPYFLKQHKASNQQNFIFIAIFRLHVC